MLVDVSLNTLGVYLFPCKLLRRYRVLNIFLSFFFVVLFNHHLLGLELAKCAIPARRDPI